MESIWQMNATIQQEGWSLGEAISTTLKVEITKMKKKTRQEYLGTPHVCVCM